MRNFFIKLLKLYQRRISIKTLPRCRFYPSCSNYAIQAIERFGAVKGLALALFRVLRCNPLFPGGVDLVPQKKDDAAG